MRREGRREGGRDGQRVPRPSGLQAADQRVSFQAPLRQPRWKLPCFPLPHLLSPVKASFKSWGGSKRQMLTYKVMITTFGSKKTT